MRVSTFVLGSVFGVSLVSGSALAKEPIVVTLQDVQKKVASENYRVKENALRVYQAKEGIQAARMNLLPKLNLWKIINVAFDPTNAIGMITDIAPFLVPSNWFRVEENKLLALGQEEGFRALWANELMTAKALYVHVLVDQSLMEHILEHQKELRRLYEIVRARELLGGYPQGASRELEGRLLALEEDERSLEVVIREDLSLLAYMMGYGARMPVQLASIDMPDFECMERLDYEDFEFRVLDSAPEIRQFDHFIQAMDYVSKEVTFAFLGSSNASRGVAGGVFDGLPVQDGLGFDTPAIQRINGAHKEILKLQKKGIEETLKRQLSLIVDNYNLDLEHYTNLKRRVELSNQTIDQLYTRMTLGEVVEVIDLMEASRNHMQADTAFFAVQYRFLANEDRLMRLLFSDDYDKKPVVLEKIQKKGQKP